MISVDLQALHERLNELGIDHDCFRRGTPSRSWIDYIDVTDREVELTIFAVPDWESDEDDRKPFGISAGQLNCFDVTSPIVRALIEAVALAEKVDDDASR